MKKLVVIMLMGLSTISYSQHTQDEIVEIRKDLVAESDTVVGQMIVDKWASMIILEDSLIYVSKQIYKYSKKSNDPVWVETKALNSYYKRKYRKECGKVLCFNLPMFYHEAYRSAPRYYF